MIDGAVDGSVKAFSLVWRLQRNWLRANNLMHRP